MKIMVTSFKRSHACIATLSAPNPAAGHRQPTPLQRLPDTHRQVRGSLRWGPFFWVLVHKVLLCPASVCFPALCKFWQLCDGVNGDLLQEGLCCIWYCCTQSLCPWGWPPLSRTSTGDTQTQFCLSLCGVPGSWLSQGLFEPSEISGRNGAYAKCELAPPTILLGLLLYPWIWGISSQPLQYLWSYWDFSDLRLEVSPYGQSSEVQPLFLTLEVGYIFLAAHCSSMSQPPLALTYLFAFNLSTDSFNVNQ